MLNRHEFLNKLLMAYYIEDDNKYIDKLKWFIFNWIDNNEINIKGGNTIRTIDTGIRCLAWIEILIHLINEDKLLDEEITKYILDNKSKELANMASTLVCAIVVKDNAYIFNVGDSRCYKISKDKSYQVTVDQNLYNYLLKNNKDEDQFIKYKDNLYAITQFIGALSGKQIVPDVFEVTLKPGEYLILTSDGVHNFTTIRDFVDSIIAEDDYAKKCSSILSKAIANRSNDNLSVVIIGA